MERIGVSSAVRGGRLRLVRSVWSVVRCRAYGRRLGVQSRPPIRPVLKHGPRSLTCARVIGW